MGRWSEHHDQRKGQWLINYIRFGLGHRDREGYILFNMDNKDFDRLMEEYYSRSEPSGMPSQEKMDEMSRKELKKTFTPEMTNIIMKAHKEVTEDG